MRGVPPEGATTPFFDPNRDLLNLGVMGDVAVPAYEAAVDMDARLGMIEVVESDARRQGSFARAVPGWESMGPNHRVDLYEHRSSGIYRTLRVLQQQIGAIPEAPAYFAERMGLEEESDINLVGLYVFGLLREFGRASDFMNYEHRQREYVELDRKERRALPVANMSLTHMTRPLGRQSLLRHWDELAEQYEVDFVDELITKRFQAFRAMTFEKYADDFATGVLRKNPDLI